MAEESSKPDGAILLPSFPGTKKNRAALFSLHGERLFLHLPPVPVTASISSTSSSSLVSPQPEKSPSGSNSEIQEQREAAVLLDSHASEVAGRRPSDTFQQTSQPQGFVAEAECNNEVNITEDPADKLVGISRSYQNLSRSTSFSDPRTDVLIRQRSQSWPSNSHYKKKTEVDFHI